MSKELLISSNRHETRVAILEDDELVEVYFQRANEYSLAGSIHKGRVTRVLPGMQSAFVDIGLDRDAFLYVTDFAEESEDIEPINAPEERAPRGGRSVVAPVAPQPTVAETPLERPPAPPVATERNAVTQSGPPATQERRDEPPAADRGGDADRRGRRSRRRRSRGGGFPDAKYATLGATEEPEEASAPPDEVDLPRIVLPGESLAKYGSGGARTVGAADVLDAAPEATPEFTDIGAVAPELPESATDGGDDWEAPVTSAYGLTVSLENEPGALIVGEGEEGEPEIVSLDAPAEPVIDDTNGHHTVHIHDESLPVNGNAAAVSDAAEPLPDVELEEDPPTVMVDAVEDLESHDLVTGDDEPEPEASVNGHIEADLSASVGIVGTAEHVEELVARLADNFQPDAPDSGETMGEPDASSGEDDDLPVVSAEGESGTESLPEGATASVREQGGRYPHRGSRRMRRRRGGNREAGRPEATEAVADPIIAPVPVTGEPEAAPEDARPRAERPPLPQITDLLKEGQEIIVQIAKEPIGQKGARITSHVALPGRYVVYMPTLEHMGVSRKIESDEERLRLKRILGTHREGVPGGYIVRTAGAGRSEEEIAADMQFLFNLWLDMRQKAEKRKAPLLLHHDLDIVQRILRDQLTDSFKQVTVDQEEMYESVLRFVQRFQPSMVGRVKLYTRPVPMFEALGISNELEKALRPKVWLKSGGYIVINQTEALVAIDVNTGKYVGKSNKLEDTIVKTNTDAVKEIVRQIRLRDLGGIIIVDFIDMDERKNRQKVMQTLEDAMRADRAPYKILQFNDFGLVAITRKRVKQSLERTLCTQCPTCEGAGMIKNPQTVVGEILVEAHKMAKAIDSKDVLLRVHPEVGKLLKSHQNKHLEEIEEVLRRPVLVKSDPMIHPEKFDLA